MSRTGTIVFVVIAIVVAIVITVVIWYQQQQAALAAVNQSPLPAPQALGLIQPPATTGDATKLPPSPQAQTVPVSQQNLSFARS